MRHQIKHAEARPRLALDPDDLTVFLTAQGEPFSRDHMPSTVKERIDAAKLGKTGACHLFRHTMATLDNWRSHSKRQETWKKTPGLQPRRNSQAPSTLQERPHRHH